MHKENGKQENVEKISDTEQDNEKYQSQELDGEDTVIWTLPDYGLDWTAKNQLLNQKLKEDGYSFSVKINVINEEKYGEKIDALLAAGKTDIAFLGLDGESNIEDASGLEIYRVSDRIKSGGLEELSGYLDSEDGKQLKDAFYPQVWDAVRVDGKIYSVPNQNGLDGNAYIAFNRKYISEDILAGFSGDYRELENILENVELPEDVQPLIWTLSLEKMANLCGYEYRMGTFIDLKNGEVMCPYETEEFQDMLLLFQRFNQDGYFGKNGELYGLADIPEWEKEGLGEEELAQMLDYTAIVRQRKFAVLVGLSYDEWIADAQDLTIVQLPFAFASRLSGSTGISKNAPQKENAKLLLQLIYTDSEYCNLLIMGEEAVDYKIEKGIANKADGSDFNNYVDRLLIGCFDNVIPVAGDDFVSDRRAQKWALYQESKMLPNAILGFHENAEAFDEEMFQYVTEVEEYMDIWKRGALDFDKIQKHFETEGAQKVKEELGEQITEWQK